MRKYKAIVIDGKRFLRGLGMTAGAAATAGILLILSEAGGFGSFSPEAAVRNVFPAAGAANGDSQAWLREAGDWALSLVGAALGFRPGEPASILTGEIPVAGAVNSAGAALLAQEQRPAATPVPSPPEAVQTPGEPPVQMPPDIPPENQAPIQAIDASPKASPEIVLGNETDYSVNIPELLASPPAISMAGDGPKALVVHTHATEAYAPENSQVYDVTAGDRSMDTQENVVKVGEALCQVFRSKGIETIHDTQLHDYPSFNGSYAHSLEAVEAYLAEYPSIQVVLDIHRDSIVYGDGAKAKPLTEIDGKPAAQLMLVVGTDQKGLTHPDWRENLRSAVHFQQAINQRYPTLMRHINLRQERFNGHTTKASMIIETGSSGNSLSEATYGLTLAAECIADYLNTLR